MESSLWQLEKNFPMEGTYNKTKDFLVLHVTNVFHPLIFISGPHGMHLTSWGGFLVLRNPSAREASSEANPNLSKVESYNCIFSCETILFPYHEQLPTQVFSPTLELLHSCYHKKLLLSLHYQNLLPFDQFQKVQKLLWCSKNFINLLLYTQWYHWKLPINCFIYFHGSTILNIG